MTDGGNSFAATTSLGIIRGRGRIAIAESVGATDPVDWFRFKLLAKPSGTRRTVNVLSTSFGQSTAGVLGSSPAKFELFSSKVSHPTAETQLKLLGRNSFAASGKLKPGLYFIKVSVGGGETQYSLQLLAKLLQGRQST
ncbi:MAG TPA: hypothetical protein V6C78_02155 [Crinalium sp.]|jgi:hypothetical protein